MATTTWDVAKGRVAELRGHTSAAEWELVMWLKGLPCEFRTPAVQKVWDRLTAYLLGRSGQRLTKADFAVLLRERASCGDSSAREPASGSFLGDMSLCLLHLREQVQVLVERQNRMSAAYTDLANEHSQLARRFIDLERRHQQLVGVIQADEAVLEEVLDTTTELSSTVGALSGKRSEWLRGLERPRAN